MGRVRSTWWVRCVALLLVGALASTLLAPSSAAGSGSLAGSYGEWIRAQLLVPDDPAADRALKEAEAAEIHARTFEAFVETFLEAYEARRPGVPVARVFIDKDLSNDALISYLQRKYTEIAADAVLPRLCLAAPTFAPSLSSGSVASSFSGMDGWERTARLSDAPRTDDVIASLRTLTPARPQGP